LKIENILYNSIFYQDFSNLRSNKYKENQVINYNEDRTAANIINISFFLSLTQINAKILN